MSSRCALRITEQGEAGPPAFTALLGLSRGCGGLGRASLRPIACIRVVRAPLRSLACIGRVWCIASPAVRAYMPRAHISAPPLLRKTCTRASRIAVFRLDFDARVHVLGEAPCGFESLARCRKSPGWVTGTGFERLWRRERDSNPRDAHAPNGFQDRRIQPLCHLSVVGNDSIEYRPT